jgi:glycosyltransferase involved in cell wall biosynthesis
MNTANDSGRVSVDGDVVIAVLTYKRNDDIGELLPMLVTEAASISPGAAVLVIDNDPEGGAREVVEAFQRGNPEAEAAYLNEVTPGIAAARNAALDWSHDRRYLVFIDDDERPQAEWLRRLCTTMLEHRAAAVAGAVISEFEQEPEPWLIAGGYFQRRRLPTGTPITVAATNNLMLDLEQVRAEGVRFDLRLGLVGGSDSLFTASLARAHRRLVWCDEAVVVDRVPAARSTRDWVVKRAYRMGNSAVRISLMVADSAPERALVRVRGVGAGGVRIAGGLVRYGLGVVLRSMPRQAAGLRTMTRGRGMVAGALGIVYSEYLRDGSSRSSWRGAKWRRPSAARRR